MNVSSPFVVFGVFFIVGGNLRLKTQKKTGETMGSVCHSQLKMEKGISPFVFGPSK